eukprot:Sspe_Gene.23869::Locus_9349_Transcript_1_1_Confidence_1.000_Length_1827::g.23869::m.23869/K14209/SLC36A, PAT; solute carrier family 36 (proton-coupled amino acid transporter)
MEDPDVPPPREVPPKPRPLSYSAGVHNVLALPSNGPPRATTTVGVRRRPASIQLTYMECLERTTRRKTDPEELISLAPIKEVDESVPDVDGASNLQTFMLVFKSFIGTGVLVLPKAFANGGILASSIFMLFVAMANTYVMVKLSHTKDAVGGGPQTTLQEIGYLAGGHPVRIWVSFSVVFIQVAAGCMYMIFMGQTLKAVVEQLSDCAGWAADLGEWVYILLLIPLLSMLVFIRKMSHLATPALVADVLIVLGLGYLYSYGFYRIADHGVGKGIKLFNENDFPLFLGTALFSFEGVCLVLPIKDAMADPLSYPKVLMTAMVVLALLYVSFAAVNYASYGSDVEPTVILNLPERQWQVLLVQVGYVVAILFTFPLQFYPAVQLVEQVFGATRPGLFSNTLRVCMVAAAAGIAIVGSTSFDHFTALGGGLCSMPLLFVFPPLFHALLVPGLSTREKVMDFILMTIGLVATVATTTLTLKDWIQGGNDSTDHAVCAHP